MRRGEKGRNHTVTRRVHLDHPNIYHLDIHSLNIHRREHNANPDRNRYRHPRCQAGASLQWRLPQARPSLQ